MTWTQFHDMHSGGGLKEKWGRIYIEAPEGEAKVIFYNRFGHNPERTSCTCCGEDYSISESKTFEQASGYERACRPIETPRGEDGRFQQPKDPWWHDHYWLEPDEEDEARARGYEVKDSMGYHPEGYRTVEQYMKDPNVLVISAGQITDDERTGSVPEQGYVWVD